MPKIILTVAEYAKRAGIRRDTVYKQINRDALPKNVNLIKVAGKNFIQVKEKQLA
jgi:predicted DNA-binding transcriptional regulator AlpA